MSLPSKFLDRAVEQLSSLPGIGKRTALRMALQLLKRDREEIEAFSQSIIELKINTNECEVCNNISDTPRCTICSNPARDTSIICVVEDIRDVMAIESTQSFKGLYHVLGGIISPMDGIGPSDLYIDSLVDRISEGEVKEVIFALSPTMEGDTTNFYLFKKISGNTILITTLSRGVAVGSELQYADEVTLGRSLAQRQEFKM
ncbi:MAG: recombination mediator RecR [Crocinitomicaceae bacterium]|jgi:recombination protein RecR|nr:recombination mediator RecR [Crocinitomicaceae bacterium]MCF8411010.1 recombination mediator RecR [Crocinitomicaceae bacterium]